MGEVKTEKAERTGKSISLIELEDIDHKVAEIFDCLDDLYNVPSCLSDLEKALDGLPLPWIKFCLQTLFVLWVKEKPRSKDAGKI